MIDLHTHSIFSDGTMIPAELTRRAQEKGYKGLAITDHADRSNLDFIVPRVVAFCEEVPRRDDFSVIPGIELTHVRVELIVPLTRQARALGARLVVVHGETLVEPVRPGTNRAALEAGVDILAHPGLISEEDVILAKERGIFLEITARRGHSITNGHVARLAKKAGASLLLNTDTHDPQDLIDDMFARQVALGSGLEEDDWQSMCANAESLLGRVASAVYR